VLDPSTVTIFYVDLCSRLQIMGSTFFSLHAFASKVFSFVREAD
jgi:hypothetical protein